MFQIKNIIENNFDTNKIPVYIKYIWYRDTSLIKILEKFNIELKNSCGDDYYYSSFKINKDKIIELFKILNNKKISYQIDETYLKQEIHIDFKSRYLQIKKYNYFYKYKAEELVLRYSTLESRCTHGFNPFILFLKNKNIKKIVDKVEDSWEMGTEIWAEYSYDEKTGKVKRKDIVNEIVWDTVMEFDIQKLINNNSYEY